MLRCVALVRTDVSETLSSSETPVLTRATRRNILEDGILQGVMFCFCVTRTMLSTTNLREWLRTTDKLFHSVFCSNHAKFSFFSFVHFISKFPIFSVISYLVVDESLNSNICVKSMGQLYSRNKGWDLSFCRSRWPVPALFLWDGICHPLVGDSWVQNPTILPSPQRS
jgi:hypothetical protein